MAITDTSNIPLSLATVSIGHKGSHTLPKKIAAIANAGFQGLELGMPDLVAFAGEHLHKDVSPKDFDDLVAAARVVKSMVSAKGLEVMLMQPFANFEGWKDGSDEQKDAWERLEGWIEVMKAVGCKTLQVGSSDTPENHKSWNGSREDIVEDLKRLADKLKEHGLRMAYENWCWSTHAPTWKDVWEIVKAVDRDNVGLCLDTFQSAGYEWADPTKDSGLVDDLPKEVLDKKFKESMDELASTIPADKIYLLQISDAYQMLPPIANTTDSNGLRPRGQWSMDSRPVPFAEGAYLPVVEMAKGVLGTGFRGWFSVEVFDGGLQVPDGRGKRGSWLGPSSSLDYELDGFANDCAMSTKELIRRCTQD